MRLNNSIKKNEIKNKKLKHIFMNGDCPSPSASIGRSGKSPRLHSREIRHTPHLKA